MLGNWSACEQGTESIASGVKHGGSSVKGDVTGRAGDDTHGQTPNQRAPFYELVT